jgi:hypothetical protein
MAEQVNVRVAPEHRELIRQSPATNLGTVAWEKIGKPGWPECQRAPFLRNPSK